MPKSTAAAAAPKKKTGSSFELIETFVHKAIGHGLVATEDEKKEITDALEKVGEAWGQAGED